MIASIFVSVACLIVLQVLLVIKVADWLSTSGEHQKADGADLIGRSAGRFTGIA